MSIPDAARPPSGVWRTLRSELLVDRRPWLRVFADDVETPSGRRIDGFLRLEGRDFAAVFPMAEDGRVVLVRQFKRGPGREVLQVPAGYIEDGESPLNCARRELLEETGYAGLDWESLGSLGVDGNRGFGVAHLFLLRGARPVQAPQPGEEDDLRQELVPIELIPALIQSGAISELAPMACVTLGLLRLSGTLGPRK